MNDTASSRRLLVVDDNAAIHDDFRKILGAGVQEVDEFEASVFGKTKAEVTLDGFQIDSAYQGQQALDHVCRAVADQRPYAVAFMDVRMPPGWDGIETTARIWEKDPDLQVVICTAYSDYSWGEMLQKLGRSDRLVILRKPFDNIEVLQLADSLTKKWHFLQQAKAKMADLEKAVAARTAESVRDHARFREIFDNSPMGIFQTSREGRILCANPSSARMVGYSSAAEIVEQLSDLESQLYVEPEQRREFLRQMELHGSVRDFEAQIRCRDGSQKWINLTACKVASPDGAFLYYEGFFYDITQRKKAEQERQEMEVQLRHAQKMESIGQLAAGIAHEINTPTQYVGDNTRFLGESMRSFREMFSNYKELLSAAKDNTLTPELVAQAEARLVEDDVEYRSEQIPAAIDQTLQGVERITNIVRAMKEFSHPGAKEKTATDLNKAIETTVVVARSEWKHVAEMRLELDPTLELVICLVGEFNQAILNLIINAAHAIGDAEKQHPGTKGTINIQTRRDGDQVEVRVADTGTGIPEAIRPRIFEPFFTTKEVGKGSGQGLSVVYNSIVKLHGGTVTFESELGKGTTFILRLPVAG